MTEQIKINYEHGVNLRDFEEETPENDQALSKILADALFESQQYNKLLVEISDLQRKPINSTFNEYFGYKMTGKFSFPSDPEFKYKEFLLKQYKRKEKCEEITKHLVLTNGIISKEQTWPWGGPGDSRAKVFEEIYAPNYGALKINNIMCVEGIFAPSIKDSLEKIGKLPATEDWRIEKSLDSIILLQEWLYSKLGGEDKIGAATYLKKFDYNKFFEKAFEGMKKLYPINDNEKEGIKEIIEPMRKLYLNNFDSLIHLGYPRRNRSRSLVNPDGLCLGPRVLHLGCFYMHPEVFNRLADAQSTIGLSIDGLIKKRDICRKFFPFENYIYPIGKTFLENGSYFGGILANFYAAGMQDEIQDGEKADYKKAIDAQVTRLYNERINGADKLKYFFDCRKKTNE
jgi:hypothetical protein